MVYVYLATGFEEIEALTCIDILRRGDVDAKGVSITGDYCVKGAHGIPVIADLLFEEADKDACEMIVLPGGLPGAQYLQDHEGLAEMIKEFAAAGKWVCAICAAPMALGHHGVLDRGAQDVAVGDLGRVGLGEVRDGPGVGLGCLGEHHDGVVGAADRRSDKRALPVGGGADGHVVDRHAVG